MQLSSLEQEGLKRCCTSKVSFGVKVLHLTLGIGKKKKTTSIQQMLFFCLLQNSQRAVSYIWVPAFHALEIPYSNKDKKKAHMKKTALDLLCLFQICFSSLTIFQILLSHSTHAYSKATQCTLYVMHEYSRHPSIQGMYTAEMFHFPPMTSRYSFVTHVN